MGDISPPRRPPFFSELGIGQSGSIPRPLYSYCFGPRNYGSGQVSRFNTRYLFYQDQIQGGIRFVQLPISAKVPGRDSSGNPVGTQTGFFSSAYGIGSGFFKSVSACIMGTGFETVAVVRQDDVCEIHKAQSGADLVVTFAGKSPVMFWTGIVQPDQADHDAVCFYLKDAGEKMYARFERDAFAVEYEIHDSLSPKLEALFMADREGRSCLMFALSKGGDNVVFEAGIYPPFPYDTLDFLQVNAGTFSSGLYDTSVQGVTIPADSLIFGEGNFISGQYFSAIQESNVGQDLIFLETGTLSGGSYDQVVQSKIVDADNLSFNLGLLSNAEYVQRISGQSTNEDSLNIITGAFVSGEYTAI